MDAPTSRPEDPWGLSDIWALRWLRVRGSLPVLGGRWWRDEFMTLAGRFDRSEARRGPIPGMPSRRIHTR